MRAAIEIGLAIVAFLILIAAVSNFTKDR